MYRRGSYWLQLALLALLGLALVAAAVLIDRGYSRYEQSVRVDEMQREVERLSALADQVMRDFLQLSRGVAAAIAANPGLDQAEFDRIAAELFREYPNVRNVAAAPDLVIRYIYPVAGNEAALGLDYRTIPAQYVYVARARDTRRALVDGPVQLVQGGSGFIARIPVFVGAGDNQRFWGLVGGVLDADDLFERMGLRAEALPMQVAIRRVADGIDDARPVYGDQTLFESPVVQHYSALPGQTWEWAVAPADTGAAVSVQQLALRGLLAALVIAIMVPVTWLVRTQRRLAAFSSDLDLTLAAIPETLIEADRDGRLQSVRSDPHGLIAEPDLQAALGERGAGAIRDAVLDMVNSGTAAPRRVEISTTQRKRHVEISVALKPDAESVLVMLADRTELVASEEREDLRHAVLEKLGVGTPMLDLLEYIAGQVERLSPELACAFAVHEPGRSSLVAVGPAVGAGLETCIGDLVDDGGAQRRVIDDPPAALRQAGFQQALIVPVSDSNGMQYAAAVFMREAPSADWSHEELTIDAATGVAALAIERARVSVRLAMADSIFSRSSEAMYLVDDKERILAVNPAFCNITGYSADEVVGREQKFLRSKRHDAEFYAQLRATLARDGSWTGEIWGQRKGGEDFASWMTVNIVPEDAGGPRRFITLFSDISEKKKADEVIWQQANYDALTQLPNRRLFIDRLEQSMRKAERDRSLIALLMVDLDGFKEVNDTLGHHIGDLLLIEASHRIVACVRASDTVSRIGGDEFTVNMVDLGASSDVDRVTGSILTALAEPFDIEGRPVYISGSIGIALYPDDADNSVDMLKAADQAMYESKRLGRNRYSWFSRTMQDANQARMQLAADMRPALQRGELRLVYQPIVNLTDGRIVKVEAMVRWDHPRLGAVSPAAFIPVAEETGQISTIGEYVLATALADLARLRRSGRADLRVSVNVSPVQFQEKYRLHERWKAAVALAGLEPSALTMEITEGVLLSPDAHTRAQLHEFQESGFAIAIDDFGTGYSSLAYLRRYAVDFLKIDRSFVGHLSAGSQDEALCAAIVEMAHKLSVKVIAEGVETDEQRVLLKAMHCDLAQGYLFAHPLTVDDLERMLAG